MTAPSHVSTLPDVTVGSGALASEQNAGAPKTGRGRGKRRAQAIGIAEQAAPPAATAPVVPPPASTHRADVGTVNAMFALMDFRNQAGSSSSPTPVVHVPQPQPAEVSRPSAPTAPAQGDIEEIMSFTGTASPALKTKTVRGARKAATAENDARAAPRGRRGKGRGGAVMNTPQGPLRRSARV